MIGIYLSIYLNDILIVMQQNMTRTVVDDEDSSRYYHRNLSIYLIDILIVMQQNMTMTVVDIEDRSRAI